MVNNNKIKVKRIGIDARFYGPIGKGLGRYIQEIVDNVLKIDRANEYVIFLGRENFDEFVFPEPRVKKVMVKARWYSLAEQLEMPFLIWREKVNLMHFPHFNVPLLAPGKFVVTIHDLILTKFPTRRATTLSPWFYRLKNLAYQIVISRAVKRAKKVLAVSEFTKNDVVKNFKIKPEKVIVTYEGVANLARGKDSLFVGKIDDRKTLLSYNIMENFILYVGNAYPHKNLESLLEVFAQLRQKRPDLRLVLVGREDYFYRRLKEIAARLNLWDENIPESPVVFTGYVPDAELDVLYRRALLYVFPSLYEGFGLPALEAMAKGCPVTSSDRASLPEILGEAALYFNPTDPADIFLKMDKLAGDQNLREVLIKKGHQQVKKYNWWECARQTWEAYREVIGK
ncbi:MAG TPA: glycosyltransferase family 1 protein [Candidatus Methylomirabilis sp.]|nr:glycosyltransferase family 1 protein [Candidatus Methylomirabilis sp.]